MNIKKFLVLSTGFGLKLMAENGDIFSRVSNEKETSEKENLLVYGCNYTVFNGDDTANGSHQKLKLFLPANPLPESWLQAPEIAEGQHLTLEAVPKTNYIEYPFPIALLRKLA